MHWRHPRGWHIYLRLACVLWDVYKTWIWRHTRFTRLFTIKCEIIITVVTERNTVTRTFQMSQNVIEPGVQLEDDVKKSGCGLQAVPLLQLHLPGYKPMYQPYKGQLCLSIHYNDGLVSVHVLNDRDLCSAGAGSQCTSYVKLSLVPNSVSATRNLHWRTDGVRGGSTNNQLLEWDELFAIELKDDIKEKEEDSEFDESRLLVTVWHREPVGKRKCTKGTSRMLGCMAFSLHYIEQKRQINREWFYLLSKEMGMWKHLAVDSRSASATLLEKYKPEQFSLYPKSKSNLKACSKYPKHGFHQSKPRSHQLQSSLRSSQQSFKFPKAFQLLRKLDEVINQRTAVNSQRTTTNLTWVHNSWYKVNNWSLGLNNLIRTLNIPWYVHSLL